MPGEAPRPRPDHRLQHLRACRPWSRPRAARPACCPSRATPRQSCATSLASPKAADLIVTIGGASVGDHDLVGRVAAGMGLERAFYKIAMRPGKPLMAGRLMGDADARPAGQSGLGHRLRPSLPAARCCAPCWASARTRRSRAAPCSAAPRPPTARASITCAPRCSQDGDLPRITPFDRQDSSLLSILTAADALLIRPLGDGPPRGRRDGVATCRSDCGKPLDTNRERG